MTETKTQEVGTISTPAQAGGALAPQDAGGSLLNFVAMAVSDPNIDVAKLDALLRMQREIVADDARNQFNRALHSAQMQMPRVAKNGSIDLGKGRPIAFTTYEDMDAVIRPIERNFGLSRSFNLKKLEAGFVVIGTLRHTSGHSEETEFPLPNDAGPGRNSLQAVGSTFSYGKRYITEAMYNIIRKGQDDDGAGGDEGQITEAQKDELVALLQETGADTVAFLSFMRIPNLDAMLGRDFAKARNALAAKKARTQKPAGD